MSAFSPDSVATAIHEETVMTPETRGPLSGVVAATVHRCWATGAARRGRDPAARRLLRRRRHAWGVRRGVDRRGLLLTVDERRTLLEGFLAAAGDGFSVVARWRATTADAVALAELREIRRLRSPPSGRRITATTTSSSSSLRADRLRLRPVPFYLYEIRDRTVTRSPRRCARCAGAAGTSSDEVSYRASTACAPTSCRPRRDGRSEPLIPEAVALGAVSAVSALAAALPRAVRRVFAGDVPPSHADRCAPIGPLPVPVGAQDRARRAGALEDAPYGDRCGR